MGRGNRIWVTGQIVLPQNPIFVRKGLQNINKKHPTVEHYISKQRQLIQGFVRTCVTSRKKIRECILEAFAGPPDCGEYSPSYQKTVNCIQMLVLSRVSQVSSFLLMMCYLNANCITEKTNLRVLFPLSVLRLESPQLGTQWGRTSLSSWQHLNKSERCATHVH